jgi:hypothetical protein
MIWDSLNHMRVLVLLENPETDLEYLGSHATLLSSPAMKDAEKWIAGKK